MKKILIVLAFATFEVFAQSTVATPETPKLPVISSVSPNALTALGDTSTNRVFIDQSGSTPTVNISQTGSGNTVGADPSSTVSKNVGTPVGGSTAWTLSSPVYLRGAGQKVTTLQTGNNNTIGLALISPFVDSAISPSVTVQQLGDNNTANISCGYGQSSTGAALTECKSVDINWKFSGNTNHIQFNGTGNDIKSAIDVLGNGNLFFMDVIGDKHTTTLKIVGDDNIFNVTQNSTGVNGSSIWVDQLGTGTKFTMNQGGTIDGVINIKSAASGGLFSITQKN